MKNCPLFYNNSQYFENDLCKGLMFANDQVWHDHRKFAEKQLNDPETTVSFIRQEIDHLTRQLKNSFDGSADNLVVNMKGVFTAPVVNILWTIIAGERFRPRDVDFERLLGIIETIFQAPFSVGAVISVPEFLLRLFPFLKQYFSVRHELFEPLVQFIRVLTNFLSRTPCRYNLVSLCLPRKQLINTNTIGGKVRLRV